MRIFRVKRLALAACLIGLGYSSTSQAASPQADLVCSDLGISQFSFDASGSTDRDGDITRYDFSFDNSLVHSQTSPVWTTTVDGSYRVRVTVYDATGMSRRSASCRVTGTGNSAPLAIDDGPYTTALGEAIELDVLSNDSDPEGVALVLTTIVTPPVGGEATIADGVITYTPDASFGGTDTFEYEISDGINRSVASVSILVTDNAAPLANDDSYSAVLVGSSVEFSVMDNDSDTDGDVLTLMSVSGAAHGVAEIVAGQISYTAQSVGEERLSYVIDDGQASATAEVSFSVVEDIDATNNVPVAQADSYQCVNTETCDLNVLANDTDADDDSLLIASFTQPATGQVISDNGELLSYEPATGFVGDTSFTYYVTDGLVDSDVVTVNLSVAADPSESEPVEAIAATGFYVNAGTEGVLLNGGASLPTDALLQYQWTQVSGDVQVVLNNANTAVASFNAPMVESAVVLTFELTVSQGTQSDTTQTAVTVGYANAPIVVVDTPDQKVVEGSTLTLAGRAFFDGEVIEGLRWTQLSGPSVTGSNPNNSAMSFIVPAIAADDVGLEMVFELSLTDTSFVLGDDQVPTDTITLTLLDNGIDASDFSEGFVTTAAADGNATPFAFQAQTGTLIAVNPTVISASEASQSRPRSLPIEAIETEMLTTAGGLAEVAFELQQALPADYSWFVYDETQAQWYDLDENYDGVSYSISQDRRRVVLQVSDTVAATTRAAGDSNAEAGLVTIVSAPGQKSQWQEGTASSGGGAMGGLWLLLLAGLGLSRRRSVAPLMLLSLLLPVQASAVEWDYFVGGGFGHTSVERSGDQLEQSLEAGNGPQVTVSGGDQSTLFKVYGGAFFASNIGVRVGFISLDDIDIDVGAGLAANEEAQFAVQVVDEIPHAGQGVSAALLGRFPIAEGWMIHSWAGIFAWQSEATVSFGSTTALAEDSGVDLLLGLAAEYRILRDQLGLRLEAERYSQSGDGLVLLGAGAAWYF